MILLMATILNGSGRVKVCKLVVDVNQILLIIGLFLENHFHFLFTLPLLSTTDNRTPFHKTQWYHLAFNLTSTMLTWLTHLDKRWGKKAVTQEGGILQFKFYKDW